MIDITSLRNAFGNQTKIVAVCPSPDVANKAEAVFNTMCRQFVRDGLVISAYVNRGVGADLVARLERLSYRTAPSPQPAAPVAAGHDGSERHRELIQATEMAEREARNNPPAINGRRSVFTGFGQEFIGTEIHGHLWGERVRYAYYARPEG